MSTFRAQSPTSSRLSDPSSFRRYADHLSDCFGADPRYMLIADCFKSFDSQRSSNSITQEKWDGNVMLFDIGPSGATTEMDVNTDGYGRPRGMDSEQLLHRTLDLLHREAGHVQLLLHVYRGDIYSLNMHLLESVGCQFGISPDVFLPHFTWDSRVVPPRRSRGWDWGSLHRFPSERAVLQMMSGILVLAFLLRKL